MKDDPHPGPAVKRKRNHHGSRVEELERLRVKRREALLAAHPPLSEAPPDLFEIRDALVAAQSSLQSALRTGWLVHRLARTLRADFDVYNENRMPSVFDELTDCRFDEESDELEDLDLRPRYKTIMRHKRLWERFADAVGIDPDQFPDTLFDTDPPASAKSGFGMARALLARSCGTAAGLQATLADFARNKAKPPKSTSHTRTKSTTRSTSIRPLES